MTKQTLQTMAGLILGSSFLAVSVSAQLPGEGPRLGKDRITQEQIESGELTLREIRQAGLRMFATPFNKQDGYGDGPMDPFDPTTPGGRPTLQNNGTFLRVNGLDGQTCLDCHSIVSNASIPAKLGVGGVGSSVTNAMFLPTNIDVNDLANEGFASFDGRFINPPFLFGSGGVELLGREMTQDLQALKAQAIENPGQDIALITKGVSFGSIRFENGVLDTSDVEGIDHDLIVKPFGRKGEFATTRGFDVGAMMFHFGMQPVEAVGFDVDADGDGVINEILIGELSALEIFNTNLAPPRQRQVTRLAKVGAKTFQTVGCAECHMTALRTTGTVLTYRFPEDPLDVTANVFFESDLSTPPARFQRAPKGGLIIPLFADLKRHNMGSDMAESFGSPNDPMFTTARLWGIADTAPYMHDGRATTLMEAIQMHGGEGQQANDNFFLLDENGKASLLTFLRTLRTPTKASADIIGN